MYAFILPSYIWHRQATFVLFFFRFYYIVLRLGFRPKQRVVAIGSALLLLCALSLFPSLPPFLRKFMQAQHILALKIEPFLPPPSPFLSARLLFSSSFCAGVSHLYRELKKIVCEVEGRRRKEARKRRGEGRKQNFFAVRGTNTVKLPLRNCEKRLSPTTKFLGGPSQSLAKSCDGRPKTTAPFRRRSLVGLAF